MEVRLLVLLLLTPLVSCNIPIEHSNNNLIVRKPTTVDLGGTETISCDIPESNDGQFIESCYFISPQGQRLSLTKDNTLLDTYGNPVVGGYQAREPCLLEIEAVGEDDLGMY